MLRSNKKGAAVDIIYFAISIFVMAIFFLIVWQMWDQMEGPLHSIGDSAEVNASLAAGTQLTGMFDFMFVGVVISIFIVMVILAMLIPVSPVFYIIYFIYLMVVTILSPLLSNVYESLSNTTLANATAAMTMQTYMMSNLPIIIFMFGLILIIVTYAKFGFSGGGGTR